MQMETPLQGSSGRVFPFFDRSSSRASSHYCDLNVNEYEDEHDMVSRELEEGHEDQHNNQENQVKQKEPAMKANHVAPRKPRSRLSIMLLDQGLFTVYKRIFVLCLAVNITFLVLAATGHFSYAKNNAALFSIANIFVAILSRNELFWWAVFWLVVKIFGRPCVPLRIKTPITSFLQSPGGIHSSCGISSIIWLVYALVQIVQDRENTSTEIIGVASAIVSLLCFTSLAAFPILRHLHHNVFEKVHRFAGWTALALLWVFLMLSFAYDPESKTYRDDLIASRLIRSREFWFTVAISILIIIPWLTVRRVPVTVSPTPSGHASLIKFQGGVIPGVLGRISPSPLSEWHAFGLISDGKTEKMMLVGAVGDYTKSIVKNPPSHLWVRQVHFIGMPYLVNFYDRILLVATGSGVGVYLSYLLQPHKNNWCLLWVAKEIEHNFGEEIKKIVTDENLKDRVIVHDTALLGRPNVSELSVDAARSWKAEVVFVTSNPEGSRDVIRACKAVGIPAFAPIWDS